MLRFFPLPTKKASLLLALIPSVFLAACGGSPSESDVRAALSKQIEEGRVQAEQIMGKGAFLDHQVAEAKKKVATTKLIGCKSDGEKAYVCDIETDASASRVRMVKGSDGWIAGEPGKG
jgi:hypothetical protein